MRSFVGLVAGLLGLGWGLGDLVAQPYPLRLTDANGTTIVVSKPPVRIVSQALFADEILSNLVEVSRLAGITQFAADPGISNVAVWASSIKQRLPFTVEAVLALRPDIVLVAQWSDAGKIQQLRQAGVPVFVLVSPRSFEESLALIQTLGRLCGTMDKADSLIRDLQKRLAKLDARVALIPANRRPSILEFNTWGTADGPNTSWHAIVVRAGFTDPLDKFNANQWGQVPISKELLLSLNPSCLVVPDWVYGDAAGPEKIRQELDRDPVLATLRAVKAGRVLRIPAKYKEAVSQFMVDAAEYLVAEAERFAGAK